MGQRRTGRSKSPAALSVFAWEDWHSKLFRLAGDHLAHPEHVQLRRTVKGGTYVADFYDAEGVCWRFTTRVGWNTARSEAWIVDERMSVTLRTGPRGAKAGAGS